MDNKFPPNQRTPILAPGYTLGGWLPHAIQEGAGLDRLTLDRAQLAYSPSASTDLDHRFMHEALLTAMAGVGLPSPNPNVGCVLVKDGKILATGGTARHGGLHGEAQALASLTQPDLARGATAYVTLEPCAHQGKQPPCADALLKAGIARCVYATPDPHPLVAGRGLAKLRDGGVLVEQGPLCHESLAWNMPFFTELAGKRPMIIGKWAQTLNGQMADQGGGSQWITGALARRYVHWLRQKYDAIMVGAGTALSDAPELTARDTWGPMRQPLKIIFDPSGRLCQAQTEALPEKVKTRTFAPGTKVVYVSPPSAKAQDWGRALGADLFYVPVPNRQQSFQTLFDAVTSPAFVVWHGTPLQSIFVEGGAVLHNALLAEDVYDAFHVFVTPSLISANTHRVGYYDENSTPTGMAHIASMKRYKLLQSAALGADVLLEFMPENRFSKVFG